MRKRAAYHGLSLMAAAMYEIDYQIHLIKFSVK
jgi:hypothetical protein